MGEYLGLGEDLFGGGELYRRGRRLKRLCAGVVCEILLRRIGLVWFLNVG